MTDIRNRITEIRKVRLGDIADHPKNWRGHPSGQRGAYREALQVIGWASVPQVFMSEEMGGLTFLNGHMRKAETPDLVVDVAVTDLNDEEAIEFLRRYDVITEMAQPIPELTLDLFADATTEYEALGDVWQEMSSEMERIIALNDLSNVEFPEYDESIADTVEWSECPECGHKFPK